MKVVVNERAVDADVVLVAVPTLTGVFVSCVKNPLGATAVIPLPLTNGPEGMYEELTRRLRPIAEGLGPEKQTELDGILWEWAQKMNGSVEWLRPILSADDPHMESLHEILR